MIFCLFHVGSSSVSDTGAHDCERDGDEVGEFDWQIEQEPYTEGSVTIGAPTYGFAGQRSGVVGRMQSELHDVIDLKRADKVAISDRRALRMQDEQEHFNDDHYL